VNNDLSGAEVKTRLREESSVRQMTWTHDLFICGR